MNAAVAPVIATKYGSRVLYWHLDKLETLLAELRSERTAHDMSVESESAEAEHNALMTQAEAVKQRATNAIGKTTRGVDFQSTGSEQA